MTKDFGEYLKLEKEALKNNNTCSMHTASTGSVYIKINGQKFRLSDHTQPSHYQMRNYTDVCCVAKIKQIMISRGLWKTAVISLKDFTTLYENKKTYKGYEIKKENHHQFGDVYNNQFGFFVDLESAINNLYYNLIKKER